MESKRAAAIVAASVSVGLTALAACEAPERIGRALSCDPDRLTCTPAICEAYDCDGPVQRCAPLAVETVAASCEDLRGPLLDAGSLLDAGPPVDAAPSDAAP